MTSTQVGRYGRFVLHDIRSVWEIIKPDIIKLKEKWGMDWRYEDVYAQCLMGRAFCYSCNDGFIIVKPQENQFTLAKELFVWICCSTASNGLMDYHPDISKIAKDIYATTIIFNSPRDGFIKVAKANNWTALTEYQIPVI